MEYVLNYMLLTVIFLALMDTLNVVDCAVRVPPVNTAGFLNDMTSLNCEISRTVQQWEENYSERVDRVISVNDGISSDYSSRYAVEGDESNYSLIVLLTQYAEAGTHACADVLDVSSPRKYAELIVLDANTTCITNSSETGNVLVEGEHAYYMCKIRYAGLWGPKMRWNTNTGTYLDVDDESNDIPNPKLVQYSYTMTATANTNQQSIRVVTSFDPRPSPVPGNSASNAPDYTHVWDSPRITVHYSPRRIMFQHCTQSGCNILGDKDQEITINIGDRIHASAEANPNVDYYTWINVTDILLDGYDKNTLSFQTISVSNIECIVHNTMRGALQGENSRLIQVTVVPTTTTTTISSTTLQSTSTQNSPCICDPDTLCKGLGHGSFVGIAIGCFVTGALIPTLLFVVIYRRMEKHEDSKPCAMDPAGTRLPAATNLPPNKSAENKLSANKRIGTETTTRGEYEDLNLNPYLNKREGRPEMNEYESISRDDRPYEQV